MRASFVPSFRLFLRSLFIGHSCIVHRASFVRCSWIRCSLFMVHSFVVLCRFRFRGCPFSSSSSSSRLPSLPPSSLAQHAFAIRFALFPSVALNPERYTPKSRNKGCLMDFSGHSCDGTPTVESHLAALLVADSPLSNCFPSIQKSILQIQGTLPALSTSSSDRLLAPLPVPHSSPETSTVPSLGVFFFKSPCVCG
ncbi:hypothetical protein M413DRAFT_245118 [Hebeloma cylindrosporum]|uniref:Uncharacterized protein n=1 Tax=Hebeloma cylindrosporum TaxID=76867 RepID=A0A0C3C435_HEBCY|nr:hypothetical protein M413DRAFT_245118 [Hebeloma cylindrosporum h7]